MAVTPGAVRLCQVTVPPTPNPPAAPMDYRTYTLAELLPEALQDLAVLAGAAPGRSEDRSPQGTPALRTPPRQPSAAPREKTVEAD